MQSRHALQTLARASARRYAQECPFAVIGRPVAIRESSSASNSRWVTRSKNDYYSKMAKQAQYRSRAALKILEIDDMYKIFKPGMTVVDLGYAPGSWTQVAVERTAPCGRVVGVDLIPASPPKGASTIQGDFSSPRIQASIRRFLSDPERGRPRKSLVFRDGKAAEEDVEEAARGYLERERMMSEREAREVKDRSEDGRDSVDVVLSDMCEPWPIDGLWRESLKAPYLYSRLMNVSGIPMRDHAGSMRLGHAALMFCLDVLKPGGSFVCKFYQGPDDGMLQKKAANVFDKVLRTKPDASRPESRECYFIAMRKKGEVDKAQIMEMPSTAETEHEAPFEELG